MKQACIFIFAFISLVGYSQEWKLKKSRDNIKIYIRQLDSTKINEFKAVLIANTSANKAVKTILDGDNLWRWNHKTSKSKIVKKISDTEFIFWMKNDLPWPVKNRDHISRIKVYHLQNGTVKIDISPDSTNAVPEDPNSIRVTNFKGCWLIVPLEDNKVEITQQLYGDPNGALPAWLLNSILTTVPYNSFLNLKEILEN